MPNICRSVALALAITSLTACTSGPQAVVKVPPNIEYGYRPSLTITSELKAIESLELLNVGSPSAYVETEAGKLGIRETALRLGVNHGYLWQLKRFREALDRRARELDEVFDFRDVQIAAEKDGRGIVQKFAIPPVIDEAKEQIAVEAEGRVLRTSNGMYRIRKQARLSTELLTWRSFLYGNEDGMRPDEPLAAQLPKTDDERTIWKRAVREGWAHGLKQAEREMLNRVLSIRDYVGMVRYVRLVEAGIALPTQFAVSKESVAGDAAKLYFGRTEVRISKDAALNRNTDEYRFIQESDMEGVNIDFKLRDGE